MVIQDCEESTHRGCLLWCSADSDVFNFTSNKLDIQSELRWESSVYGLLWASHQHWEGGYTAQKRGNCCALDQRIHFFQMFKSRFENEINEGGDGGSVTVKNRDRKPTRTSKIIPAVLWVLLQSQINSNMNNNSTVHFITLFSLHSCQKPDGPFEWQKL